MPDDPRQPHAGTLDILVLTRTLPSARRDGSAAYLLAIVEHLARRGHRVHLQWEPAGGQIVTRLDPELTIGVTASRSVVVRGRLVRVPVPRAVLKRWRREVWMSPVLSRLRRAYRDARGARGARGAEESPGDGPGETRARRVPALVEPLNERGRRGFRSAMEKRRPDVIVANYAPLAEVLPPTGPPTGPLRVVLTHDVWHDRLAGRTLRFPPPIASCEGEAGLLRRADVVAAIQWADAARFTEMLGDASVVVVAPIPACATGAGAVPVPGRCLYVGSQSPTNVEGLLWLLAEVWPAVRDRVPTATLHVCGDVGRALHDVEELPAGVEVLGRVEDLAPEYRSAAVCLAPYLSGTGLKIKIIEALSHRRATVTTSAGLLGIEWIAGRGAAVHDDAVAYADEVCELLLDDARRRSLEEGAGAVIAERFAPDTALAELVDAVEATAVRSSEADGA